MHKLLSPLVASVLVAAVVLAQNPSAPVVQSRSKGETAAEQFKNVQVLKDTPVAQWWSTMAFIAGSLGVGCEHCHTNPWASDEKPAKKRAREMMRMVAGINQQYFPDQSNRVTCATCHNGSTTPLKSPKITTAAWMKEFTAATAPKPSTAGSPTPEQIINRYRGSIGGQDLGKVGRYYKGTVTTYNATAQGPRSFQQEVWLVPGDRVMVNLVTPAGLQSIIVNGSKGWIVTSQEAREMNADEILATKAGVLRALRSDYLPEFTQAEFKGSDQVRGHETWIVELVIGPEKRETCWFDRASGLLIMRRGNSDSAFGEFPEETWLEDYRDVGGLKLPLTVISAAVSNGIVRRYDEVKLDPHIDPKRFEAPKELNRPGNTAR